jgi:hypothetical protein
MDLPSFTGEFGGLMAGAFITGVTAGWTACVRFLLTPERDRARQNEERLDAIRGKIESRFWGEK